MTENKTDVLVIAHNICTAFDYLTREEEETFLFRLRAVEKDCCQRAQYIRRFQAPDIENRKEEV